MSKNVLTDKDLEKLAKLGVRIRACLWNRNDTGVPCQTDRLEAVRLMQEYLTIHDIVSVPLIETCASLNAPSKTGSSSSTLTVHVYNGVVDHIDGLPNGWLYDIVEHTW